jgi:hypothetical protein
MEQQTDVRLPMDEFIAKANIEHFKTLLRTELDENKRRILKRLLAEEELELFAALRSGAGTKEI